jgi:hypothetical protein
VVGLGGGAEEVVGCVGCHGVDGCVDWFYCGRYW